MNIVTDAFKNKSSWTVTRLRYFLRVQSGDIISSSEETENGFPLIGGNGVRGYTTKFNTLAPALVIGRVGARCGCVHLIENNFWASEHCFVVYPHRELDLHFGKYLLETLDLNRFAIRTAQPLINTEIVENTIGVFPPLETQHAIADYLDRETSKIDQMLSAKETLLKILDEKRRAIITHAVTKGVNPSAKLKSSGIPWLGDIPAHWKTEQTRWLFRERDDRSETGEEEMLTVSHLTGVTPRSEKDVNMFEAETNEGYKRCQKSDLVINTLWAWMGAMGIAPVDGIVSPAYNVYTLGPELDPAYIDVLVRIPAFIQEVTRYSKGVWSSRLRLYPEGFYEVCLPVPPLDEQRAIVGYIAAENGKIDELRIATLRTNVLLQERRTALIAEVVVGRLNIG